MKKIFVSSTFALILLSMLVLADADINDDGKIDLSDLILVTNFFGKTSGYDQEADSDNNGMIDIYDVVYVASRVGTTIPTCSDDCTPLGSKQCSSTTSYQTCGNYDADACLEWSSATDCPGGQSCLSGVCSTQEITLNHAAEVYTDPETGKEVWRMTTDPVMDLVQYYDWPTISPNGRYLIFRTSRGSGVYIINSDGSGERGIGDWFTWNSPSRGWGVDFTTNNMQGWWSPDSRQYYTFNKTLVIDIEKFLSNKTAAEYIWQVSSTYFTAFYFPMLSPDGRTLFGFGKPGDVTTGNTIKLMNIDGTNYREFEIPYYYNNNTFIDTTHGWLGNHEAWYMNDAGASPTHDMDLVFDVNTGEYKGSLSVFEINSSILHGPFGHAIASPSAYYIGNGEGWFAGTGNRGVQAVNTKYWLPNANRQMMRIDTGIWAIHYNFDPDEKLMVMHATEQTSASKGMVVTYPIPPNGSGPLHVARFQAANSASFDSTYATFTPDGTKILFSGYCRDASNRDIYIAVYKKPGTPSSVTAVNLGNGQMSLSWKPAKQHREIKEYEIYTATSQTGEYTLAAIIPETITYLDAPSKISASDTTINVDSTAGFPSSGYIEILGLSTAKPTEIIQYTAKTATSFTGCTRGAKGTTPAEHWNDAFVWKYTGENAYTGTYTSGTWYKIRSVEWSSLRSEFSSPVTAN